MRTWMCFQVKDVLFEPVRKTQDAMHFKKVTTKEGEEMWMPCGPREPNAKQTTMIELASAGLAAKVKNLSTLEWCKVFIYS
jgi:vacuolar protein-sorting-associated protein 4